MGRRIVENLSSHNPIFAATTKDPAGFRIRGPAARGGMLSSASRRDAALDSLAVPDSRKQG